MNELLTTAELCELLKVARSTIWRWRQEGLPIKAFGRRSIRFDRDEVQKWSVERGVTLQLVTVTKGGVTHDNDMV